MAEIKSVQYTPVQRELSDLEQAKHRTKELEERLAAEKKSTQRRAKLIERLVPGDKVVIATFEGTIMGPSMVSSTAMMSSFDKTAVRAGYSFLAPGIGSYYDVKEAITGKTRAEWWTGDTPIDEFIDRRKIRKALKKSRKESGEIK